MSTNAYVVATIDTRTAEVTQIRIYSADHKGLTTIDRHNAYALLHTTSGASYERAFQLAQQWVHQTHPALARRFASGL